MTTRKQYTPNAVETMGRTFHVAQNHPKATDKNPGTKALPFKTISKAGSMVDMCDTVIIGWGIYREQVPVLRHGHQFIPESKVTFKAVPGAKVYLKG